VSNSLTQNRISSVSVQTVVSHIFGQIHFLIEIHRGIVNTHCDKIWNFFFDHKYIFFAIFITSYLECCWSCPSKPRIYLVSRVVRRSSRCRTSYIVICISKLIQNMFQLYNSHKIFLFTLICNWHWNCVKPTVLSWFKYNLPRRFITSYFQSSTCECSSLPRISHPYWVKSWNNM